MAADAKRPIRELYDVPVDDSGAEEVEAKRALKRARRDKMVNAAVWLAEQGCYIGWGDVAHGQAVKHHWKSGHDERPGSGPGLASRARNSVVVPAGRVVVLDIDRFGWYEKLVEAGLPTDTFTVITPSRRGNDDGEVYDSRQVYGLMPEFYDIEDIPAVWAGGVRTAARWPVSRAWCWVRGPRGRTASTSRPRARRRSLAVIPDTVFAVDARQPRWA